MNRCAAIIVLLGFLGLGTGGLERLHDLAHDAEDARNDHIARAAGLPVLPHPHDESNCPVHAQLHMPLLTAGWTPPLICLGLLIAFLTLLETPLLAGMTPLRIDCRGPPGGACIELIGR